MPWYITDTPFTPAYKGSMDNFQDLRKLIKEQKYEDAYNTGK